MRVGQLAEQTVKSEGIGARLLRKEDDRYMRGTGQFVGDIKLAGQLEAAFVRSPIAHGRLRGVHIPAAIRERVFWSGDLADVKPIRAVTALAGFKPSEQWPLATDKVRHVGECIAVCVAPTRAEAEDLAEQVQLDIEELPAVYDMLAARKPGSALVHEPWGDNLFLTSFEGGDMDAARRAAYVTVTRELRTARQAMSPLEGRGAIAYWDTRLDQLVVTTSTQQPHIVRSGLSECLGIDHGRIRVVAPDVGGGFGYKGILLPEEIVLGWVARRLGRPVRWLEDRRENLTAGANCREHHYVITGYADRQGKLLGIEAEATIDAGAYSSYPFSACLEGGQVVSILPGLYDLPHFRCTAYSVATNKPPILPYRGVARTGVCFALEVLVDAIARELKMEPNAVRMKNLVRPEQMPFTNITRKYFDSGDYPECLRRAISAIKFDEVRARQATSTPSPRVLHSRGGGWDSARRLGIGFAMYCEQAGHGTTVYAGWGIPMVPGHEQAIARLTPDGGLELRIGAHSHGQGLETTLSQVAHQILGLPHNTIKLVHGDTEYTPYSTGTWGSRCMIMSGGAVAAACEQLGERAKRIGAKLLQCTLDEVTLQDGKVTGPKGSISLADIAHTWYRRPQDLPADVDPAGLEVTAGYKPLRDSGTFSYAAHAAVVAVDPETGEIEIVDYVIVEDGGTLVNPMIVDGQIWGGAAQGIGTALYEEMQYSSSGQPLASTLADYLLPGPTEVPSIRIEHMETPSPLTRFGQKGIGEGGAIAPPAAITNAINDALKGLGAEMLQSPVTPRRIIEALAMAEVKRGSAPGAGGHLKAQPRSRA